MDKPAAAARVSSRTRSDTHPAIRALGGPREFFQAIADAGRTDELVRLATELAEMVSAGAASNWDEGQVAGQHPYARRRDDA